ncbi:hypothetical protein VFPPC_16247 [Pochonia chlamydosporia 170]|uniref:Uncharacterized protein n=1 Tax=Pochonia chlamydosporia 170 TaxID=1380566 RepID=A0A179FGS9_METCM|nr:hypothetical protein VFPPC_16247 [Pochonia chlamydosporia 170]OAQ64732.1 hypothetical protein VFPPC_16247 [Pochonia chlamydosporia 170]
MSHRADLPVAQTSTSAKPAYAGSLEMFVPLSTSPSAVATGHDQAVLHPRQSSNLRIESMLTAKWFISRGTHGAFRMPRTKMVGLALSCPEKNGH